MTRPGIERRRAARAKAEFSIRLAERDGMRPARLKDLSSSGLCCHFSDALREMTLVRIALDIPGSTSTHEVQGAVVRCAKLRDVSPPTYEVAIFFTEIQPAGRAAIQEFVTSQVTAV